MKKLTCSILISTILISSVPSYGMEKLSSILKNNKRKIEAISNSLYSTYREVIVNRNNAQLIHAVKNNNLASVKSLLNAGANPNIQDNDGNTALILAVCNINFQRVRINLDIVQELINAGANPNIQNNDGDTALMWVASQRVKPIEHVKTLLNAGANPNIQSKYGGTALMKAVNRGNFKIVEELINAGADTNLQDNYGNTALMGALVKPHSPVVEALLNAGANPDLQNKYNGNTFLHYAILNKSPESVEALLNAGAKVNLKNKKGETALMLAVDCLNSGTSFQGDVIKELLNADANPNIQDPNGKSCIDNFNSEFWEEIETEEISKLKQARKDLLEQGILKDIVDTIILKQLNNLGIDLKAIKDDGQ